MVKRNLEELRFMTTGTEDRNERRRSNSVSDPSPGGYTVFAGRMEMLGGNWRYNCC